MSALQGSFTTYLFQGRTAERAQSFERDERLRYEQVNACSAFASAMTELKRGLITMWFYQRRDAAGAAYLAARIECDRLGASAEAARFRVQLVSGDRLSEDGTVGARTALQAARLAASKRSHGCGRREHDHDRSAR